MRVFLTGGTGYIGSAVAGAFRQEGNEVTALVRAEGDSARLRDLGCAVVGGDLQSLSEQWEEWRRVTR